jgi:hypothetical protein
LWCSPDVVQRRSKFVAKHAEKKKRKQIIKMASEGKTPAGFSTVLLPKETDTVTWLKSAEGLESHQHHRTRHTLDMHHDVCHSDARTRLLSPPASGPMQVTWKVCPWQAQAVARTPKLLQQGTSSDRRRTRPICRNRSSLRRRTDLRTQMPVGCSMSPDRFARLGSRASPQRRHDVQ